MFRLSTVLMENISTHEQLMLLEYASEMEYYSKINVIFCGIIKNLKV